MCSSTAGGLQAEKSMFIFLLAGKDSLNNSSKEIPCKVQAMKSWCMKQKEFSSSLLQ